MHALHTKLTNFRGVPRVYDFQTDRAWLSKGRTEKVVSYIVMEYLDGGELFDLVVMSNKINLKLSEDALRYIFSKLLYSLARLHMEGIAHRDLKLENIMVTSDFEIKIIDFGFSGEMIGH